MSIWRRFKAFLRAPIPRTFWTSYRIEGWEQSVGDADPEDLEGVDDLRGEFGGDCEDQHWVCIWRQWLWFEWDVTHFRVVETP